MPDRALSLAAGSAPRVEYRASDAGSPLGDDVLAAVSFGDVADIGGDPRRLRVGLEPLAGSGCMELWRANAPVRTGRSGAIRHAADTDHLFGIIELDEREHGGISGAAEAAYAAIRHFQRDSSHPHLLRVWNYFDGINRGTGDAERYKEFCIGRAAGLGAWLAESYPAATVIGRRDGDPTLQVYWIAARLSGKPIENPRQTNPYRYPRQYGPIAPQFSRAMLVADRLVMLSGTASIVGHASHHPGDLESQLAEMLQNVESLLHKAAGIAPHIPPQLGANSLLKVYLRDAAAAAKIDAALSRRLPRDTRRLILAGDVCRADLLIEADGAHR
jgi:chorismate lyase/3-hydroxybenzoate synthase